MAKISNASDLKYHVEQSGREPHFFTRQTMKFFGDTMRNYGVRQPRLITTVLGESVMCYELYRRRPVKGGSQSSAFFCAETFKRVFPHREYTAEVTCPECQTTCNASEPEHAWG